MTDVVRFPNSRRIREEACGWIGRIDAGLSASDRAALDEWLAESEQHRAALLNLSAVWDEMDSLSELAGLFPLTSPSPATNPGNRRWPSWAFAGTLASLVAVIALWVLQPETPSSSSTVAVNATPEIFETGVGQQATAHLDDGSVVTLNTDTRLQVRYSSGRRSVVLERGEASFDVAHDPTRPFSVYAGSQIVQAIGTVFNVHLAPSNEVEVAVTEGRVRVLHRTGLPERPASAGSPTPASLERLVVDSVVSAGQVVIVQQDISTLKRLEPEDIDIELAWQRGMLIFRGEPLEAVLREVGRYTTTDFELADQALASVRVGGYFRVGEIDGLLLALRENFGIQANRNGQTVVLKAN